MKNLKVISTLALIMSLITMVGYYVDDLFIRGISIFVLIMSAILVANMVKLVFKEVK